MTNMKQDEAQHAIDTKKQLFYREFIANHLRMRKQEITEDTDFTRLFLDILKVSGFIETIEQDTVRQFHVLYTQVVNMIAVVSRTLQHAAIRKIDELSKSVTIEDHRLSAELVTDTGYLCNEWMYTHGISDVEDDISSAECQMRKHLMNAKVSFAQQIRLHPDYIINCLQFRWKDTFNEQDFMNCVVTYMEHDAASGWSFRKNVPHHLFTMNDFWDIKYLFFDASAIVAKLSSNAKLNKYSFAGKNYVAESIRYAKC